MTYPRKNNIKIYKDKELTNRRGELLENIIKSDTYLPDSLLHDDLDVGMLDYVKKNFIVVSDGEQIPIIPKILTIQRWGEISSNWNYSDDDGNIRVPFISLIRKPDPQPGTNPVTQRTIPDRKTFFYTSVPTWDGNQRGSDIYKIPQPVAIDIGYEVVIVCNKLRDINRFNKIILQKFSSRQSYTTIKGHYIPIVLERISDNSPIDTVDSRRFYKQIYEFTMLGYLVDPDEFEVKPSINRLLILNEFIDKKNIKITTNYNPIETKTATFIADGSQTTFSVGENIGFLFFVSINGIIQQKDLHYYWISQTSRITFVTIPLSGSEVKISYYPGRSNVFQDAYGRLLFLETENFTYDDSSLVLTLNNNIDSIMFVSINGILEDENQGYVISSTNQITLLSSPVIGSKIIVSYLR